MPLKEPYILESGLIQVVPYFQTRKIFCKERWFQRSVADVLRSEFNNTHKPSSDSSEPAQYLKDISTGNVTLTKRQLGTHHTVRGPAVASAIIESGSVLEYRVHMHEPPIRAGTELAALMQRPGAESTRPQGAGTGLVIYESEDMLVINKPAGVPVHPTGKYHHNSLTLILESCLGYKVFASHRLDRLTSGILVLGKSSQAASRLAKSLRDKSIKKKYLALVSGKFSSFDQLNQSQDNPYLEFTQPSSDSLVQNPTAPKLRCTVPIFPTIFTAGPSKFMAELFKTKDGNSIAIKEAATDFELVWYDPRTDKSLVRCEPLTGRTHQIRKHLAALGHPIVDDPIYRDKDVSALCDLVVSHCRPGPERPDAETSLALCLDKGASDEVRALFEKVAAKMSQRNVEKQTEERCEECGAPTFVDPDPDGLKLSLHAHTYSVTLDQGFEYTAPAPHWATFQNGLDSKR